ncbi:MAG: hypothetical protein LBT00_01850 [Spirochaetaceae bacterium]|jgi:hypothetical protein|nr:hypothetical protein [Spirochaetaceae bacterium]
MNDVVKKSKVDELVHLVLLLAGGVSLLGSYFLPPGLKEILSGLGTALLASAIVGFLTKRYVTERKPDLRKEWGLINIYRKRTDKDEEMNNRIKTTAEKVDGIVQGGLFALRNNQDVKLKERLERGLIMRLLIPKEPHDSRLEDANKGLRDWYHSLTKNQKRQVTIREYDGIPQEMYFRVDDLLAVGPYHTWIDGPRTVTYLFDAISTGGKIYTNHFDKLWEDSEGGQIH